MTATSRLRAAIHRLRRTGTNEPRGHILVVDHITPRPDQDSGSASTFSYLQILVRAGYHVTFAPMNLEDAGRYSDALRDLGIRTVAAPPWPSIHEAVAALAPQHDIVLLYRGGAGGMLFDLVREVAPEARIVFHPVDLHFLREQREAELKGDTAGLLTAENSRRLELDLIRRADATIVVSTHEHELLRELAPGASVHQIPILRETPPATVSTERRDLLFLGGFDHLPNADAIIWFVREVWPLLLAHGFTERLIIAGSNIPAQVAELADDRVDVRGWVEDLESLFAGCRLSIAPLRFGGGIKGKVVTSLSQGVPVVATSVAAEGMRLEHGANVLIADTPDEFAQQIIRACTNDRLWRTLSTNGRVAFAQQFSHEAGANQVLAVFGGLLAMGPKVPILR